MKKKDAVVLLLMTLGAVFSLSAQAAQEQKGVPVHFTHNGRTVHGLVWGRGAYGVVLSHGAIYDAASWTPLAIAIARNGMTALALEEVEPEDILAARTFLTQQYGVKAVAVIGASAGGNTALSAVKRSPEKWDQLILLSSTGDARGTGPAPKLFTASEGEGMAEAVRQMAKDAPGDQNEVLIVKGSAHAQAIFRTPEGPRLTKAILDRLSDRSKLLQ